MRISRRYTLKTILASFVMINERVYAQEDMVAPIQKLTNGLLQIMKAGSTGASFEQRYDILAPIIDQSFDLNVVLQSSTGNSIWSLMSADQQEMLLTVFRRYTIATYVNSFDKFDGQQFTVSPTTRTVGNDQIVQTTIVSKAGEKHNLDYVLRGTSGWRAVDVLADGSISRVAVQRSDWRKLLRDGGIQALADSLHAKSISISG